MFKGTYISAETHGFRWSKMTISENKFKGTYIAGKPYRFKWSKMAFSELIFMGTFNSAKTHRYKWHFLKKCLMGLIFPPKLTGSVQPMVVSQNIPAATSGARLAPIRTEILMAGSTSSLMTSVIWN